MQRGPPKERPPSAMRHSAGDNEEIKFLGEMIEAKVTPAPISPASPVFTRVAIEPGGPPRLRGYWHVRVTGRLR
jgi:hypothetical protein